MKISGTLKEKQLSKPFDAVEESKLLERLIRGESKAFSELVMLYEKKVYRICFRFFSNEEEALDASQEVFVKVFKAIRRFEGRSSLSTWIYRIATNTCLTMSDKKKKEKEGMLQLFVNWWNGLHQTTPEEEVLEKEMGQMNQKIVAEKISLLPEIYRLPVILKDIEGMSIEKVGEILEAPVGTVKSRLNRGRRILQEMLQAYVVRRDT